MMNAKEYINSGAIETWLFGLASSQDKEMHEQMEKQYPEVKAARLKAEVELEQNTPNLVFATPEKTKQKVLERLQQEMLLVKQQEAEEHEAATLDFKAAPKSIRWFRTAIAASFLLLLGSVLMNFYYYSQYRKSATRYSEMQTQQAALVKKKAALEATLAMVKSPGMKQVPLDDMAGTANTYATVYWDKASKDVYIMTNNLQVPAPGTQYQLWAQVDGKMVDAGMLTWNDEGIMVKMHNIPRAEAFAISLEKEGGSTNPTLSAVIALGKV
jgi:hypothetical protein